MGDKVTLEAGGKPPLMTIVWSTFQNATVIVRYYNMKTDTELFPQYSQRLSLNESTGDLIIRNLKAQDAGVYRVRVVDQRGLSERKIKLVVREPLPEPATELIFSGPINQYQLVWLKCSSAGEGVGFAWQVNRPLLTGTTNSSEDLIAVYDSSQGPVKFTCITTRDNKTTSRIHPNLTETDPTPSPLPPIRISYSKVVIAFFLGMVVGMFIMGILLHYLSHKKKYDLAKIETSASSI